MEVRVLLFGPEADAMQDRVAVVEVEHPVTCDALRCALEESHPALGPFLAAARFAINAEVAQPVTVIARGDEVALIGMVGGG
jgi:molybdopterin converting factor small subunit